MFRFAEGTDHQCIQSVQLLILPIGNALHIGKVSEITDAEAQDRQLVMQNPDRDHLRVSYMKRLRYRDAFDADIRDAAMPVFGKAIRHPVSDGFFQSLFHVEIHRSEPREGTQIVNPAGVVIVLMREKNPVNLPERQGESLQAKVGCTVDQQLVAAGLNGN